MEREFITNPVHGGKVTCYKCSGFIRGGDEYWYSPGVFFHKDCFNHYEHYYGLDKPID